MTDVVLAFAYRYEPDWLIEQLLDNCRWVDRVVSVNTRGDPRPWVPKAERVAALRKAAFGSGADWVLDLDPDERVEDGAEATLRTAADRDAHDFHRLHLRELWTPDAYRVDGRWRRKTRMRFHRVDRRARFRGRRGRLLDVNIYHLKMIEPDNREERRRVHAAYNTWDNRSMGFDYLTVTSGLRLQQIPDGRGFTPPYRPYRFEVDDG